MSAGACPRSRATSPSSILPLLSSLRCIRWEFLLPLQRPADGVAIKTLQPDHHEMLGLFHVGTRECEVNSTPYPLHHDRRGLVSDAGMTLDAQHAGEIQGVADTHAHGIDAGCRRR